MSAWICPDDMVELIVTAAVVWNLEKDIDLDQEQAQALFNDLRQTNYDSVNYRYSEDERPEPHRVSLVMEAAKLEPMHLLQIRHTIDSYIYQSCEHQGWATSEAYKLCVNLGEWIDGKLTKAGWAKAPVVGDNAEWVGMNKCEWEWTRDKGFKDPEIGAHRLQAIRNAWPQVN